MKEVTFFVDFKNEKNTNAAVEYLKRDFGGYLDLTTTCMDGTYTVALSVDCDGEQKAVVATAAYLEEVANGFGGEYTGCEGDAL